MIHEIMNEEQNPIKELIILQCKYLKPNIKPNQMMYIVISEYNSDLGAITFDTYTLEKFKGYEEEYLFYKTTPIKLLLLNEIINKNIKIKEQILITLALQLTDTTLLEHLDSIGITKEEYNQLLNNEIVKISKSKKLHTKQTILETLNININEFKTDSLIIETQLENII